MRKPRSKKDIEKRNRKRKKRQEKTQVKQKQKEQKKRKYIRKKTTETRTAILYKGKGKQYKLTKYEQKKLQRQKQIKEYLKNKETITETSLKAIKTNRNDVLMEILRKGTKNKKMAQKLIGQTEKFKEYFTYTIELYGESEEDYKQLARMECYAKTIDELATKLEEKGIEEEKTIDSSTLQEIKKDEFFRLTHETITGTGKTAKISEIQVKIRLKKGKE